MSITDELRKWVRDGKGSLLGIADRIDAEHERECKEQYACGVEHGIGASIDASMIQTHGYVELPKDADGVPIRPGDELVIFETGEHIRAYDIELYDDGRWLVCDYETMDSVCPDRLRHHHAPTVEDVLREFADEVQRCCDTQDTIAEYAAKLREVVG